MWFSDCNWSSNGCVLEISHKNRGTEEPKSKIKEGVLRSCGQINLEVKISL